MLSSKWESLLGGRVDAWPGAPTVASTDELLTRFGSDAIAAVMHHGTLGTLAVVLDAPFALTLAARSLGADDAGARRAAAARVFGSAQEGALAMLFAQAATLVCGASPPPVVRGVTERLRDAVAAIGSGSLLVWPWRVTSGIDVGEAWLWLDPRAMITQGITAPPAFGHFADSRVPIALRIACAALSTAELSALSAGDVLLTDHRADALTGGFESGACALVLGVVEVPISLRGNAATIASDARTTRRIDVSESDNNEGGGAAEIMRTEMLASVPVEVDVVIARTMVSLAEIAAWRVGEVISFPSRVGDLVEIRAGGRAVAHGELCDVDGQLGVRVTDLL